jgi:hypothetical protein
MKIELLQTLRQSDRRFKGRGRVAFTAHQDQIRQALKAGYPLKEIWRVLRDHQVFPYSYEQFALYVRNRLRSDSGTKMASQKKPQQAHPELAPDPSSKTVQSNLPRFEHRSGPDSKDDLI